VQGDIFVQISAYLKLYCDYVNNYGLALQELHDAKKKATTLADFLKVCISFSSLPFPILLSNNINNIK
jgi:hypothetical protein